MMLSMDLIAQILWKVAKGTTLSKDIREMILISSTVVMVKILFMTSAGMEMIIIITMPAMIP